MTVGGQLSWCTRPGRQGRAAPCRKGEPHQPLPFIFHALAGKHGPPTAPTPAQIQHRHGYQTQTQEPRPRRNEPWRTQDAVPWQHHGSSLFALPTGTSHWFVIVLSPSCRIVLAPPRRSRSGTGMAGRRRSNPGRRRCHCHYLLLRARPQQFAGTQVPQKTNQTDQTDQTDRMYC